MVTINEILKTYFNEFKKHYKVSNHINNIIQSIINCRTEKMGHRILECEDCGYEEITYCSCRNRHCPLCQMYTKENWVHKRKKEIINTKYYHFVFTLPKELDIIAKMNEELIYNLMFKCVKETLMELTSDKKYLGAQTGAIIILHTWAQNLSYHPHLHLLVPAGGLDKTGKWLEIKGDYFIPAKVLSAKFKKKFMFFFGEEVKHNKLLYLPKKLEYLYNDLHLYNFKEELKSKSWYVYLKEAYSGPEQVIEYLGRYTHRVAISNNRIKKLENGQVTFSYRDSRDNNKIKEMTLDVFEFIRRYLFHILPKGFMKIRYIGILSNRNKSKKLFICQIATKAIDNKKLFIEITIEKILIKMTKGKIFICPACNGNRMRLVKVIRNDSS